MSGSESCTLEKYVNGGDTVTVCIDINSESWEKEFSDNIGVQDEAEHGGDDSNDKEQDSMALISKSYKDVIASLEDIQLFLETRG